MKRACTVSSSVASLAVPYFSTLPYTRYDFRKKSIEHKTCVLILSTSVRKFLILRRTERDIINVHTHVKCPLCVSEFNETSIFSTNFRKILKYQISLKRPMTAELVHVDRRTDGLRQTDMTKLIVVFRNFANALQN